VKYVIGVDLGTSAVKVLLINQLGAVVQEISKSYPLIQEKSGYSEQDPEQWVEKTTQALAELVATFEGDVEQIEGISFSGQMHGLVLLNQKNDVLRNAILWNDTRTTKQCQEIYDIVGKERLLTITKNPALEGFTLPKLLWVKEHEPEVFEQAAVFMLPKDYLRYRLTGKIHSEYSDAAGTLLLNVSEKTWSEEICDLVGVKKELCPPLVESHECVGTITVEFAKNTGLTETTKVFAGGLITHVVQLALAFFLKEKRYVVLVHLELSFLMKKVKIRILLERFITLIMLKKMPSIQWVSLLLLVIV